ncbi:MAG: amidohydrolase family protein [Bacteroidetes bacterium]|nr:amidohydrolase family protein [Bacteroidota bacterium]MDA1121469.1 amidohydrolase family protein [Bacteroidota bacterium]
MKHLSFFLIPLILIGCSPKSNPENQDVSSGETDFDFTIQEVNEKELLTGTGTKAIVGVTLVDGNGGPPAPNTTIIIEGNIIRNVGESNTITIPPEAEVIDGKGLTLLPGLIDAHFHLDTNKKFPNLFLRHGITSARDPGAWIESYDGAREAGNPVPRLFLTGPHLDIPPAAYPHNSYLVRDAQEARIAVNKFIDQGGTAVKVYFRLPVSIIAEICSTAHERGIPVTGHLEITNAMDAIQAGLDGIEHITSFGTVLLPNLAAEAYKQSVYADNAYRGDGRYIAWNSIDLNKPKADSLVRFLNKRGTYVCPTLGAFEYRFGEDDSDTVKVKAFKNMMTFTGMVNAGGGKIVVGSHSWGAYSKVGWAYQQEMLLLAESGLTNMEIIEAATMENARFFRIEDRLGSIEIGKQADLILIEGNPIEDLKAIHNIRRVMLNGAWVPDVEALTPP